MTIRDKVKEVLRKTDEMMTREDRAILRQYEGVGGLKEEEATVEGALSEFYTPTPIVKKMWELMDAYNPDAYEVLEPTCGRGRFLDGRSDNHFTAYECDDTSARIAKILCGHQARLFSKTIYGAVGSLVAKKSCLEL